MALSQKKIFWLSIGWIFLTLIITSIAEVCHCVSFDYFSGKRTVSHLLSMQSIFYFNVILSSAIAVEYYFHIKWIVPENNFRRSDLDTTLMLLAGLLLACIQYGWLKSLEVLRPGFDIEQLTVGYAVWAIIINIVLTFYARKRIIGTH
jgi:hypothetical protein